MHRSALRLRVALLAALPLLGLPACRTSDNLMFCRTANEACPSGLRCNVDTQRCETMDAGGGGRTDGSADTPAGSEAGSDGPVGADAGLDAAVPCQSHAECTADPGLPLCVAGACVSCRMGVATACQQKNPATPACATAGACVECVTSRNCTQPTAPICTDSKCVPCTADSQCKERDGDDPGLCLAHLDGRCATDAEVIFVRNNTPCIDGLTGPGSADMPFCQVDQALESITTDRRILLLRGSDAFGAINVRKDFPGIAGGKISIIGQPGVEVVPGAFVGVTVGGGDVFLRGLTIREGVREGVLADGSATVRMYQCVIRLNNKGGLRVTGGAGFEVVNSIFDGNKVGLVNNLTPFGGAYLGEPADGRPGVFRFNTVVRNEMVGVACGKPNADQELSSVLLADNGTEQRNCRTVFSREGGNPLFDPAQPYRLTASSPCLEQGDPASYPPDDWKGEARPGGTRSDCGADEFHPN